MARVAYLMDRIMKAMGLHGRAFVPMLSGFACAVPAVMATFDQLQSINILDKDPTACRVPITDIEVSCKCDAGLIPKRDSQTNQGCTGE